MPSVTGGGSADPRSSTAGGGGAGAGTTDPSAIQFFGTWPTRLWTGRLVEWCVQWGASAGGLWLLLLRWGWMLPGSGGGDGGALSWLAAWVPGLGLGLMVLAPAAAWIAHRITSAVVVPAQNSNIGVMNWLVQQAWFNSRWPGAVSELRALIELASNGLTAQRSSLRRRLLETNVECTAVRLHTADGAVLDGMLLRNKDIPVVGHPSGAVLLGGNAQHYERLPPMELSRYLAVVNNVLVLNYRGMGRSTGYPTCRGLILDACTGVQFLQKYCSVPAGRVVIVGHSLGGGIGVQAAALMPPVRVCAGRTFSRIADVAAAWVMPRALLEAALPSTGEGGEVAAPVRYSGTWWGIQGTRLALALLRGAMRWLLRWELDTARAWRGVAVTKWTVCHASDQIIPRPAQLATELRRRRHAATRAGKTPDDEIIIDLGAPNFAAHNRALTFPELARQLQIVGRSLQRM